MFQPARNGADCLNACLYRLQVDGQHPSDTGRTQDVFQVVRAHQRRLEPKPAVRCLDRCADTVQVLTNVYWVNVIFGGFAVTERGCGDFFQEFLSLFIRPVDYRRCLGFFRQVFGKKTFFALPVSFHIAVKIEVILAQVGKHAHVQKTVGNPVQIDGVGRDL